MDWVEKVRKLVEKSNVAELSRSVGMHATAITDAVNKRHMPRADKAIKFARALKVPVDWLFDDAQDWPPPTQPAVSELSTTELLDRVKARTDAVGRDFLAALRKLGDARLAQLDSLAGKSTPTVAEQQELDAGHADIAAADLAWLSYHSFLSAFRNALALPSGYDGKQPLHHEQRQRYPSLAAAHDAYMLALNRSRSGVIAAAPPDAPIRPPPAVAAQEHPVAAPSPPAKPARRPKPH